MGKLPVAPQLDYNGLHLYEKQYDINAMFINKILLQYVFYDE